MQRSKRRQIALGLLVLLSLLIVACGGQTVDLSVTSVEAADDPPGAMPAVTISPLSGPAGTIVEVTASGFGAHAQMSIRAGAEGAALFELAGGSADAEGTFVAHIVAEGEPGTVLAFTAGADGQLGIVAQEGFQIIEAREPSVTISPASGPAGTIVEVVASGFPPTPR